MNGQLRNRRAIRINLFSSFYLPIQLKWLLLRFLTLLLAISLLFCKVNFALAQNEKAPPNDQISNININDKITNNINNINNIKTEIKRLRNLLFILSGILFGIILGFVSIGLWYILKQIEQIEERHNSLSREFSRKFSQPISQDPSWLSDKVRSLEPRLKSIEDNFRGLQNLIQLQQKPQSQKIEHDLPQPRKNTLQTFCDLYNDIVEGFQDQDEFRKRHQPVRFGVANALKRRNDPSIEQDFQSASNGDYYAVEIKGSKYFAVVPRFDLTFQDFFYGPGAMGLVFNCSNYNPQLRYRRVKVIKPALFEPDAAKQHWTLKEKGELDLGQGE